MCYCAVVKNTLFSYVIRINNSRYATGFEQVEPSPDYKLLFVTSGSATYVTAGRTVTVAPRDYLFLQRGGIMTALSKGGGLECIIVRFDFLGARGRALDLPSSMLPAVHGVVSDYRMVHSLLVRTLELVFDGLLTESHVFFKSVLAELLVQCRGERRHRPDLRARLAIQSMVEEVRQHPHRYRSVPELAAEIGLSRAQFARVFQHIMGTSPGEFVIHARVERAKMLLATTSRSLASVAERVGYRDVFFFSRQFKQHTGIPPGAYRKREQKGTSDPHSLDHG